MTNTKENRKNAEPCTINKFSTLSFVNRDYFNKEKSYHDIARGLYCVMVDMNKLGIMSEKQQKQAKHIMDLHTLINLRGINTTFVFELSDTEGYSPYKEFNICIYSLDEDKIISRANEWNEEHHLPIPTETFTDDFYYKWEQAYEELEAFGKTL